jgi:tetratricopeptide (TPR) repeat protein
LRKAAGEYDEAAAALLEAAQRYLLRWGYHRKVIEWHSDLQGKVTRPKLQMDSAASLGRVYHDLGDYGQAITYYEQALDLARAIPNPYVEPRQLCNLGLCYARLGQTARAGDLFDQALTIVRRNGDREGEGLVLGSQGLYYAELGQPERAVESVEQARGIAHESAEHLAEARYTEGRHLGTLGLCYGYLGQPTRAAGLLEEALAIARDIQDRDGEAHHLHTLADVLIDAERYDEAVRHARDSLKIADEIGSLLHGSYGYTCLARAYLLADVLPAARDAADAAGAFEEPTNISSAWALLGLIALRQGDQAAALAACRQAIARADNALAKNAVAFAALDARGLALCVEALCDGATQVSAAVASFRAARVVTTAPGITKRIVSLVDALSLVGPAGLLAAARAAAGGASRG